MLAMLFPKDQVCTHETNNYKTFVAYCSRNEYNATEHEQGKVIFLLTLTDDSHR